GLAELIASDDTYFIARSRFGFTALEPNLVQMRVDALSTVQSPSSLRLSFECRINNTNGKSILRLRNWISNQMVQVASYTINFTESTFTVDDLAASKYIRASEGEIELHPKQPVIAVFTALGFDTRIDYIGFEV